MSTSLASSPFQFSSRAAERSSGSSAMMSAASSAESDLTISRSSSSRRAPRMFLCDSGSASESVCPCSSMSGMIRKSRIASVGLSCTKAAAISAAWTRRSILARCLSAFRRSSRRMLSTRIFPAVPDMRFTPARTDAQGSPVRCLPRTVGPNSHEPCASPTRCFRQDARRRRSERARSWPRRRSRRR